MRRLYRTAIFLMILLILAAACSHETRNVIVQGTKQEDNRRISDRGKVQSIIHIIDTAEWEKAKIDIRPPDYRLGFEENEGKRVYYDVWVDPEQNLLTLATRSLYGKLSRQNSADLLKLLSEK
ncbi:hypothetical protein CEF21_05690 [Bacillus sp. FJAT-42376]|uniref:hypothetical protein n=1 Tax=Bacillus sp. FJAT-42376 TaxID=2014076 RepID=UPI000F4E7614|nr:hypothetical protein [Bacillus sp. FJAT-42376]AZB41835.1 hypothetical protein CEF21_05690 [Bacillus sp. FJAT-42376]